MGIGKFIILFSTFYRYEPIYLYSTVWGTCLQFFTRTGNKPQYLVGLLVPAVMGHWAVAQFVLSSARLELLWLIPSDLPLGPAFRPPDPLLSHFRCLIQMLPDLPYSSQSLSSISCRPSPSSRATTIIVPNTMCEEGPNFFPEKVQTPNVGFLSTKIVRSFLLMMGTFLKRSKLSQRGSDPKDQFPTFSSS